MFEIIYSQRMVYDLNKKHGKQCLPVGENKFKINKNVKLKIIN